jgi:MYXO-CTERM domain-containing protein
LVAGSPHLRAVGFALVSFVASLASAQVTVSEPPDFANIGSGTATVLGPGTNTFSGVVTTPTDPQDRFRVTVPTDTELSSAVLTLDTSRGFMGFAVFNAGSTLMASGSFAGTPLGAGTYDVVVAADFAIGNTWSIDFEVVATCTTAADCDDGNECTDDVCRAGTCAFPPSGTDKACGDGADTPCTDPDTCDGAGACGDNHAPMGTSCGDRGIDCLEEDTCDGEGTCIDNGFSELGVACGDAVDDACTDPDSCDGAGTCLPNHADVGAACGDQGVDCFVDDACDGAGICVDAGFADVGTACGDGVDDLCTDPDSCDGAGVCLVNHAPPGAPCGDQGIECVNDDACDGAGLCMDMGFVAAGTACGDDTDDVCTDPDSCDGGGTCAPNHAENGTVCEAGEFCRSDDRCSLGICREGLSEPCERGEACDEEADTCVSLCGNGDRDPGEECDTGDANSDTEPDACRTDCTTARCGDGVVDRNEDCDGSEGCSDRCRFPDGGVDADAGPGGGTPSDGGGGCRTAPAPVPPLGLLLGALGLGLLGARRRRRR